MIVMVFGGNDSVVDAVQILIEIIMFVYGEYKSKGKEKYKK